MLTLLEKDFSTLYKPDKGAFTENIYELKASFPEPFFLHRLGLVPSSQYDPQFDK